jgi:hypothetical protein
MATTPPASSGFFNFFFDRENAARNTLRFR